MLENKMKMISIALIALMVLAGFGSLMTSLKAEKVTMDMNEIEEKPENNLKYGMGELEPINCDQIDEGDPAVASTTLASFDWSNIAGLDFTTPIRHQGSCGSCYAFAAIGALEAKIDIIKQNPNYNVNLAEQYLVSCGKGCYHVSNMDGCSGGKLEYSLKFLKERGVFPESVFNYESGDGSVPSCSDKGRLNNNIVWKITDYGKVPYGVENTKSYLVDKGPLPTKMDVYEDFYNDYESGIYEHISGDYMGIHDVVIVGYNDDPGYWICKNSWGTGFGESGWFRIKYGECGIESDTYYISGVKEERPAQLDTTGNMNLGRVSPYSAASGSFYIYNSGNDGTSLNYKISDYPSWGSDWLFSLDYDNNDLDKSNSPATMQVWFYPPSETDTKFTGTIKVVNENNECAETESIYVEIRTGKGVFKPNNAFPFVEKLQTLLSNSLFFRLISAK